MKRLFFLGLMLTALGTSSAIAQDDIYYNSSDAKKDASTYTEPERRSTQSQDRYDNGTYQSEYTDGNSTVRTDESEDDYVDYSDDSYASRFRRFNGSMYGMGYYNSFYNPYWYDPYFGGWGYSPGWSISIGTGWGYGPYWSSGWGWNTWYGYPGFYSAWNSPYCSWGNYYGGGYYGWGGYGMGYLNGYYAGAYGYGASRVINYGPRYSMNGFRNNTITRPGVYSGGRSSGSFLNGDRRGGLRVGGDNNTTRPGRESAIRQDAVRQDNVIRNVCVLPP